MTEFDEVPRDHHGDIDIPGPSIASAQPDGIVPPRRAAVRGIFARIAALSGVAIFGSGAATAAAAGPASSRTGMAAAISSAGKSLGNLFRYPAVGSVPRDAIQRGSDWMSILDFIPEAEHAAIRDGTSTYDCLAAFQAALAVRQPRLQTKPFGAAGPPIRVPAGVYHVSDSLQIKRRAWIIGDGGGYGNGSEATRLIFPANTHGFIIHAPNTIGAGVESPATTYGAGSILEGLQIEGTLSGSTSGHGVWMRTGATLRECRILNFAGDGFHIFASAVGASTLNNPVEQGNSNLWRAERLRIEHCGGHGVYIHGPDSNAGLATMVDSSANGGWGIFDSSFLGNTYVGCRTDGNKLGGYKTVGALSSNVFVGCYAEDHQAFGNEIAGSALVLGGVLGAAIGRSSPLITISGDGTGATAVARTAGGKVTDILMTAGGTNYTRATVAIQSSSGSGATARAVVSNGAVSRIEMTAGGSLYAATDEGMWLQPSNVGVKNRITPFSVQSPANASRLQTTSFAPGGNNAIQLHAQGDHASGVAWAWDEANGCWMTQHASARAGLRITTNLSGNVKCGRSDPLDGGSVVLGNDNLYIGASVPNARKMSNATAAPANGAHAMGDIIWNRAPAAGGNAGWICVVAGTPGTWKKFGPIEG